MVRAKTDDVIRMTVEEYLEFEAQADVKHEFVDGFVFAMAGAGDAHNLISGNIFAPLRLAIRATPCRAYINDMKLYATENIYYYPDVFVTCTEAFGGNEKHDACLIVEILSTSTAHIDREEKLYNYRRLPSLEAYVLVSQTKRLVEVYRRLPSGIWQHEIIEEGSLELPCVNISLSLEDIYEDVEVEELGA